MIDIFTNIWVSTLTATAIMDCMFLSSLLAYREAIK